jgi:predicted enzyme related to lactoylglutathione lyase
MIMLRTALRIAAGLGLLSGGVAMAERTVPQAEELRMDHIHLGVRDIPAALAWFETMFAWKPSYRDARIAVLALKPMTIILDHASTDAVATLSFRIEDVDREYERLVSRGAVSLEAPNDKPYGVRGAYLEGPASLRIELEGPLKKQK